MDDLSGKHIGTYQLIKLLGDGGFSEVYLGRPIADPKRLVAIKILKHTSVKGTNRQRFFQEADIIKRLQHKHIIKIIDTGIYNDVPFLVMEYAPNGTLGHTRLPLPTIASYLTQLADALQYAHDRKVIHCDIKPENILVGAQGELLLSDFGIAVIASTSAPIEEQLTREQETNPKIIGTLRYMGPEQINGNPCRASDQYALGIVAYEWLCGVPPFKGLPLQIMAQHLSAPPPALHEQNPALPPKIEEVILKALAKDPERRFPSVTAFAQAFKDALFSVAPQPDPVPASPSRWKHLRAHVLTSLLTLLLTLAITFGSPPLLHGLIPPPVAVTRPDSIIKIGVDLPLSGLDAHDGQPVLNAIRLAVAQDSIPGYTLQVDALDDVGQTDVHDSTVGATNVQKMINDAQVAAILGPFNSDVALGELSDTNTAPIAQIAASTTSTCLTVSNPPSLCQSTLTQLRPTGKTTFFRTAATGKLEGSKLVDYLTGTLHYQTASIINDPGSYGKDLADSFASQWTHDTGTLPTSHQLPSSSNQDEYRDIIAQIAASQRLPDVVFYAGQAPNALLIHTLMEQNQQLKMTAFAVGGGVMNKGFVTNIEDLQSGLVYAVSPVGDIFGPASTNGLSFYSNYVSSYDDRPTVYAASAYDCTQILIEALRTAMRSSLPPTGSHAMNQAQAFRQAVIAAIQNDASYSGTTGHYSFSNGGGDPDNGGTVTLYQFDSVNQRWTYVSTL